jgi:hypothetical protein
MVKDCGQLRSTTSARITWPLGVLWQTPFSLHLQTYNVSLDTADSCWGYSDKLLINWADLIACSALVLQIGPGENSGVTYRVALMSSPRASLFKQDYFTFMSTFSIIFHSSLKNVFDLESCVRCHVRACVRYNLFCGWLSTRHTTRGQWKRRDV